jgi:8-oxo-dGTP pyrophosphatase MutT (NUDIX family)
MSYRAGIILVQEGKVALIERHRAGSHYFTFPGGHVDEGETPEQAAVREAEEELGLKVRLTRLVAIYRWKGKWQFYYFARDIGGEFGKGTGIEMTAPRPDRGTYLPLWLPIPELASHAIKPAALVPLIVRSASEGWAREPVLLPEEDS